MTSRREDESRPAGGPPVSLYVSSKRPVQVQIELRECPGCGPLLVGPLAGESGQPPLVGAEVASHPESTVVKLTVDDEQPIGRYQAELVEPVSGRTLGRVIVVILS